MIQDHQVKDALFDAIPWLGVGMLAWKVLRANAAAERLLDYPPQELIGVPIDNLVRPEDLPKHLAGREGFAKAPKVIPLGQGPRAHALRKNGSTALIDVGLYGNKELFDHGLVIVVMREVSGNANPPELAPSTATFTDGKSLEESAR